MTRMSAPPVYCSKSREYRCSCSPLLTCSNALLTSSFLCTLSKGISLARSQCHFGCRPLLSAEYNLRFMSMNTIMASLATRQAQRVTAGSSTNYLHQLPLNSQRALVKAVWTTALPKQQSLVKFGSPMQQVRQHYSDYPLDSFVAPRELAAEDLLVLLPYLVRKAGPAKQKRVEDRLQSGQSGIDHNLVQTALTVLSTAFREASQGSISGELCRCYKDCMTSAYQCLQVFSVLKQLAASVANHMLFGLW